MCANAEVFGRKHGVFQNFEEKKSVLLDFSEKVAVPQNGSFFFFFGNSEKSF